MSAPEHDGSAVMAHWESVAQVSERMRVAANQGDWDALVEHERECAGLIATLRRLGDAIALDAPQRERKAALIRTVLAHDAEIRRLTQPWLARLESMLRTEHGQQRVQSAYR